MCTRGHERPWPPARTPGGANGVQCLFGLQRCRSGGCPTLRCMGFCKRASSVLSWSPSVTFIRDMHMHSYAFESVKCVRIRLQSAQRSARGTTGLLVAAVWLRVAKFNVYRVRTVILSEPKPHRQPAKRQVPIFGRTVLNELSRDLDAVSRCRGSLPG